MTSESTVISRVAGWLRLGHPQPDRQCETQYDADQTEYLRRKAEVATRLARLETLAATRTDRKRDTYGGD